MMLSIYIVACAISLAVSIVSAGRGPHKGHSGIGEPRNVNDFQALAIKALQDAESDRPENGCTLANARVRRDW
jgi:hypothetical protein